MKKADYTRYVTDLAKALKRELERPEISVANVNFTTGQMVGIINCQPGYPKVRMCAMITLTQLTNKETKLYKEDEFVAAILKLFENGDWDWRTAE